MQDIILKAEAKLGKSLVEAATKAIRSDMQANVLAFVKTQINNISANEERLEELQSYNRLFRARIAALEAGQFSFDKWRDCPIFDDKRLNENKGLEEVCPASKE